MVSDCFNLTEREQFYLDVLRDSDSNDYYNICLNANNMLGFIHSIESRRKMSKSQLGNKNSLGYKHSDKTRNRMSKAHTGSKHKEETIIKMIKKAKKIKTISKKFKSSKISEDIRTNIINDYHTGKFSTRKLADKYGISKSTIWSIVRD